MESFYITSIALPRLCLVVLLLTLLMYFSLLTRKAPGTWWIVGAMGAFLAHNIVFFFLYTSWSGSVPARLTWSTSLIGAWAFLAITYRFLGNPFPRESRIVLWISGILATIIVAVLLAGRTSEANLVPERLHTPFTAAIILLITVSTMLICIRRAREPTTTGNGLTGQAETNRRAFRALAVLAFGFPLSGLVALMLALGTLPNHLAQHLILIIWAVLIIGFITVYANFVPKQTSFQVKVVGFAFSSMITVLGIASIVAFREAPSISVSPAKALRFEPVVDGGYKITVDSSLFDPRQGPPFPIRDEMDVRTPVGFAFPFADTTWTDLVVDDDAFVFFGSKPVTSRSAIYIGTSIPWIAPLMSDLAPTGKEVYMIRDADRITLTWKEVQSFFRSKRVTLQLVLEIDGDIVFRYEEGMEGIPWFRGLSPGRVNSEGRQSFADTGLIQQGAALVEDHRSDWFAAEHRRAVPFALLILVAGAAMLLVFPFYLHKGITRPLKRLLAGVRRTTAGDLECNVDIGAQDEIGILTENFNQMQNALRQSEASLRSYADELEKRVRERTAELDEKNASLEATLHTLKTTQSQLIQSEKMASLGQLTAGIAHEIKNPLNFVNNFAEVNEELSRELKEIFESNNERRISDVRDDLDEIAYSLGVNSKHISKHGKRADSIVNSMMEHAREGGGQRLHVGLNPFVEENINLSHNSMLAQHSDFGVEIERDLDVAIGTVEMSAQEMGRALINVLNNAFDAVHKKRQSASSSYRPKVRVDTRQVDNGVEIRVQDNGPGIPSEIKEKIFEPFFTTKPTGSGTGLGLSLAYDIVTQGHAGMMTVESKEGEGATFVITLPV